MNYDVIFKPSAGKQLQRLPAAMQQRIIEKLSLVQANPRSAGATKLAGAATTWRVRGGDYRIVYEIRDAAHKVFITIIAHRREVYRGL